MLRYSGKILGMIKECNLDLLGVKGKHNIMLRNFLRTVDIEKSDIKMVECAITGGAECIVSNDTHLTWKKINEGWEYLSTLTPVLYPDKPLLFYKPKGFCNAYDERIVNLSSLENSKNMLRRGLFRLSGRVL